MSLASSRHDPSRITMMATSADDGSMAMQIDYLPDHGEYEIIVETPTQRSDRRMTASAAPERGMDSQDYAAAIRIGTELAEGLDRDGCEIPA